MGLLNNKIGEYESNIKKLPDKVVGNAAWLKEQFDGRTDKEVKKAINSSIDMLVGQSGASEIGAAVPSGVTANPRPTGGVASVQAVLQGLRDFIEQKIIDMGAGDMAMGIYDPLMQKRDVFTKASTSKAGIVQLEDSTTSQSNTTAATPKAINSITTGTTPAGKANRLTTPRSIQTHLGYAGITNFDGTQNVAIGITGVLGVASGGTGTTNGIDPWNVRAGTFGGNMTNRVEDVYDSIKRIYTQASTGVAVGTFSLITRRK